MFPKAAKKTASCVQFGKPFYITCLHLTDSHQHPGKRRGQYLSSIQIRSESRQLGHWLRSYDTHATHYYYYIIFLQ